jgi:hypothetical protein
MTACGAQLAFLIGRGHWKVPGFDGPEDYINAYHKTGVISYKDYGSSERPISLHSDWPILVGFFRTVSRRARRSALRVPAQCATMYGPVVRHKMDFQDQRFLCQKPPTHPKTK